MNKILMIIFVLMWSSVSIGKGFKGNFKVVLDYTTNLKHQKVYTLERRNKKIFYNGMNMPGENLLRSKKSISYLVMNKTQKKLEKQCYAGTYTYSVEKNNRKEVEKGCLESKRFGRLVKAFNAI